jgi:hypothetical protein
MAGLTIVCVLRSGGDYTPDHVEALRAQVQRHLRTPHAFLCLTDQAVDCDRLQLLHSWPGWWSKIELFRPDLPQGIKVYMDLDTVVVRDFTDMARAPHRFTMLHNMTRGPGWPGSGLMAWSDDLTLLYDMFRSAPDHFIATCNTSDCWGDQGFIYAHTPVRPQFWQDRWPERVVSYKKHCRPRGGRVPPRASIVCYHGQPRPWQEPLRGVA